MDRKEEIILAAEKIFLQYGIHKTTLEDIARECGINKTALYYYFRSKSALLASMFAYKLEDMRRQIRQAVDEAEGLRSRIGTFMIRKMTSMIVNKPFIDLFIKENLPQEARLFLEEEKKKMAAHDFCLMKEIIRSGIEAGEIEVKSLDSLALILLGVTYGGAMSSVMWSMDWKLEDIVEESLNVIFTGIALNRS